MNTENKNPLRVHYDNIINIYSPDTTTVAAKIMDVSDYIKFVCRSDDIRGNLYRGQQISSWKITSSLTRAIYPQKKQADKIKDKLSNNPSKDKIIYREINENIEARKNNIFNGYLNFINNLPAFLDEVPNKEYLFDSELSQLLLSQHYGYPTRFIDWTLNPLVSLYFAVEKSTPEDDEIEKDGEPTLDDKKPAVFIYNPEIILSSTELNHALDALHQQILHDSKDLLINENFSTKAKEKSFKLRLLSMSSIISAEKAVNDSKLKKQDFTELDSDIQDKLKVNLPVISKLFSGEDVLSNQKDNDYAKALFSNVSDFNEEEQKKINKMAIKIIKTMKLALHQKYPPIALTPFAFDKRMSNQESVFTIQDNIEEPFSPKETGRLKKLIILKPYLIKTQLIKLGIVESKIYPSISGLLNTLKFIHINENYNFID